MDRAIRRVGLLVGVLMLALMVNINVQQVILANDIKDKPGNQRSVLEEYDRERGPILVGSAPVARSIPTDDQYKYLRVYKNGPQYAPATGFYSALYGASGIERTENPVLSGSSNLFFVDRIQQLLSGRPAKGGAVTLTLDAGAQAAAYSGLGSKVGSVTAIEPSTGAILALASTPSFNPNNLATHDLAASQKAYEAYTADPNKPLLNRPLVSTPPPGSVFKLVTTAAALESGKYTPESIVPGPASYQLPGSSSKLNNWQGSACGPGGKTTLTNALAVSCNSAFAWLGNQLGQDAIKAQAEKFGFNNSFSVPMRAATSRYPGDLDAAQTAMSAIGQFDVTASTLQMAMVGASIGNSGVTMNPYLVRDIRGPDLQVTQTSSPSKFATAMSASNAAAELGMMVDVVQNGTGSNARISGVSVGGKTGTAETGAGRPAVAWFVAVAPAEAPRVAVAVSVENAGGAAEVSGNQLAAPIARAVIAALLNGQ
ncbi:MAG: penicillin-binding protein 2 [Candidatus Nanopelagicales bacterium]|nr:penicillin-binding protein 2 [Candidatus Nanopelagicales bacterium]